MKDIVRAAVRRSMRSIAARLTNRFPHAISHHEARTRIDNLMVLAGMQAAMAVRHLATVQTLGDVEFKVFSQWGEDGIIEWLVSRLPGIPPCFVEFGVEKYSEANTRFLLVNRNWRGLVMDSSDEYMNSVCQTELYWRNDLSAVPAFVTPDNINSLISDNGFAGDLGILSIDIDSNDYWIWNAISVVNPWIVIAEYNAVLGDLRPLTIPYTPGFNRGEAHTSFLYWGASIGAWTEIAEKRGYSLLGTNRAGCNAFFVRNDLLPHFDGAIKDKRPRPSLYRESRSPERELSYLAGRARLDVIADSLVFDVRTGETLRLSEAGEIYSENWKKIMGIE